MAILQVTEALAAGDVFGDRHVMAWTFRIRRGVVEARNEADSVF